MALKRIYIVPLAVAVILPTTLLVSYIIAVLKNHVEPLFPYISEVGSLSPESCIFGQGLNLVALLGFITVYIKYMQVSQFPASTHKVSQWQNIFCLAIGIAACLGLELVANFQETNVPIIHQIGLYVCCSFTTIYFIMQAWFSLQMKDMGPLSATITRFVIALLCIILSILVVVYGSLAQEQFKGERNAENYRMWSEREGGWEMHLVSTISQWILVFLYCSAFLTFVPEFTSIIVEEPVVTLKKSNDGLPAYAYP